jgi:hypothetical protein
MKQVLVNLHNRFFSLLNYYILADTLQRHLIRSLCADMCDSIIREIDTSATSKTGQLSIEVRIINMNRLKSIT